MADREGGSMMMVMMIVIAAVVGLVIFTKKGAPSSQQTAAQQQQQVAQQQQQAAQQQQFAAGTEPQYASVGLPTNPNTGALIDPYTIPGKVSVPIISGSVISRDPYLFTPESAGMCQCNDQTCCYYSPFYERHAYEQLPGPETRACKTVNFGDPVAACNSAISHFQSNYQSEIKTSYARAQVAHDTIRHFAARPAKARLHAMMVNARIAKMFA